MCLCCAVLSRSVVSDFLWPGGLLPPQAPLSMGFSRQQSWSGLPSPPPKDPPNPGIEPMFPTLQTDSWPSEPPGKPIHVSILCQNLFPFRLLHGKEQSSLCYIVDPSWLSILRQWHPIPVLLSGKSHGWRSLVGCSLWVGHNWATSLSLFTFMHWRRKWQPTPVFLPGESQDRGACWAAVYGVAQSRTWLKRLSSSSSSSVNLSIPKFLMIPSPTLPLLATTVSFSKSMSLFLFCK